MGLFHDLVVWEHDFAPLESDTIFECLKCRAAVCWLLCVADTVAGKKGQRLPSASIVQ